MSPMADADHFYPDEGLNDQRKLARERHFHVVEVPILRLLGFLIVTVLAFIHQAFVPAEPSGSPFLLGAVVVSYSLVSWAVLYKWFDKTKVRLGTLFLSLDVFAFIYAIYFTGAEKSWLFFLLFIRTADQTNTSFKRALGFAQLSVAAYGLLLARARVRRAACDRVASRSLQAADPVRRERLRCTDGADRGASAGADDRCDPRGSRSGQAPAGTVNRARGGAACGRKGEPHQERISRQHEPRDPHADERHHRPDRPDARYAARTRAAGAPHDGADVGAGAAGDHQRHPRHLEDRGGTARAGGGGVPAAGSSRSRHEDAIGQRP